MVTRCEQILDYTKPSLLVVFRAVSMTMPVKMRTFICWQFSNRVCSILKLLAESSIESRMQYCILFLS